MHLLISYNIICYNEDNKKINDVYLYRKNLYFILWFTKNLLTIQYIL